MYLRKFCQIFVASGLLALLCAGCAGMDAANNASITRDPYSGITEIDSHIVKIRDSKSQLVLFDVQACLRGIWKDKGHKDILLYVNATLDGATGLFRSATDSEGKNLPFQRIDKRRLGQGLKAETFSATLTQAYLLAHRDSGLNVRFYGRRGDITVIYPAQYVQEFLVMLAQPQPVK